MWCYVCWVFCWIDVVLLIGFCVVMNLLKFVGDKNVKMLRIISNVFKDNSIICLELFNDIVNFEFF